jgi:hypothetical protein
MENSKDSTEEQSLAEGTPASSDQPPIGDESNDDPSGQHPQSRAGQPKQGASGASKPNGLGTGFVPQSPQLTAEMMAGSKAQQAAQRALDQQIPIGQSSSDHQNQSSESPGDLQDGESIASENASSSKLTKKEGAAAINQKVKGGAIDRQREGTEASGMATSKTREREEGIKTRQLKHESWFAKLPPELRKSIRAGAGQKPPRAYEERLKKYFQSVD